MTKERVAVALSGGVDSSVAALLLKEAGYEVLGIYMRLWDSSYSEYQVGEAKRICSTLAIPFHVVDLQREFERYVVDYFCQEYQQGQTPNPCVACNQHIKFGFLLDKALSLGTDYLATGHYAQIEYSDNGYHLLKAADASKDQSYFLYTLSQEKLRHIIFPLSGYTKVEVKQRAERRGLSATTKPSQDLCFISGKNYRAFLSQRFAGVPGDIVDSQGKILGHHRGLVYYTIGQRHGLGLASGKPLYITKLEPRYNRIVLGEERELYSQKVTARKLSWVAGEPPPEPITITAKIRYKSREAEAMLFPPCHCELSPPCHSEPFASCHSRESGNLAQGKLREESHAIQDSLCEAICDICFSQPQRAITPGQAIVFYKGEELLGGGTIENKN